MGKFYNAQITLTNQTNKNLTTGVLIKLVGGEYEFLTYRELDGVTIKAIEDGKMAMAKAIGANNTFDFINGLISEIIEPNEKVIANILNFEEITIH